MPGYGSSGTSVKLVQKEQAAEELDAEDEEWVDKEWVDTGWQDVDLWLVETDWTASNLSVAEVGHTQPESMTVP